MTMTKRQKVAIEWLKQAIMRHDGLGAHQDKHEYKTFEVKEPGLMKAGNLEFHCPLAFVTTEVGRKNDEGTMAEALGRVRRLIQIGPRGGMTLLNAKNKNITGARVAWELVQ